MSKEMEYNQDDRTVLFNPQGQLPTHEPLTDLGTRLRYEKLETRMVHMPSSSYEQAFNSSVNPVVAAAGPLLSAIIKLKADKVSRDLHVLKDELTGHLRNFESRMLNNGMEHHDVLVIRYMLCTVADEAVTTTSWGNSGGWSVMSLLSSFHNETSGGVRFFDLLEDMTRIPVKHLPVLELVYICLSLGFTGKYRVQNRGSSELEALRDGLYRQIRHLRGDVPRELSPHWAGLVGRRSGLVRIVPMWFVAAFTAACVVVMYAGFAFVLSEKRESVLQRYLPPGSSTLESHSTSEIVQ